MNKYANAIVSKLQQCFEHSFVMLPDHPGWEEFIAHKQTNLYFSLTGCNTETDINCRVLEYLSRGASVAVPYNTEMKNSMYRKFVLGGINRFLGTAFTEDEMTIIYCRLGNGVNHKLAADFVESGYNLALLKEA